MRTWTVGALCASLAFAASCGSSAGEYENAERPPAPLNVSIAITDDAIRVSPARVGAGPVVLLISNQTERSRDLLLAGSAGGCVAGGASSGPINPQGVARVPVDLVRGACTLRVRGGGLAGTRLTVGAQRPSAQHELLQP